MSEQTELVYEILKTLSKESLLDRLIIIGSWAVYFYRHHFKEAKMLSIIRTTDIDIDVNLLKKTKPGVNITNLLKTLGFDIQFHGDGSMSLIRPELKVEFLVPEIGKGSESPLSLPGYGITAQPLRYLELLEKKVINIDYFGIPVKVPHPAYFGIHKLIVSQRRSNRSEKSLKDITQGIEALFLSFRIGEEQKIREIVSGLTKKQTGYMNEALKTASGNPTLAPMLNELPITKGIYGNE